MLLSGLPTKMGLLECGNGAVEAPLEILLRLNMQYIKAECGSENLN